MSSRWLLLLVPLLDALGARLAETGNRANGESPRSLAPGRAATGLTTDVVWRVLRLVPTPVLLAWSIFVDDEQRDTQVLRVIRPGSEWVLNGSIQTMSFWPAGDRFVTAGRWNATVWHAWTGSPLQSVQQDRIGDMQVFPDGQRVLAFVGHRTSHDIGGTLVVWDADSGEVQQRLGTDVRRTVGICILGVSLLAWSEGGPEEAEAVGIVIVWDLAAGSLRHELRLPEGYLVGIQASPGGSKLLATTLICGAYLWDVGTGHLQLQFDMHIGVLGPAQSAVSRGGERVVILRGGQLSVWDSLTGEHRRRLPFDARGETLLLLPGGRRVVAFNASEVALWDTESGERLFALESDSQLLESLKKPKIATSSCGRLVAACGKLWPVSQRPYIQYIVVTWDTLSGRALFRTEHKHSPRPRFEWCGAVAVAPLTTMAHELLG